uniref:MATH domain-containing protein n=1 Tax=Noccaea caerulescens TaxID=107243 RepID=A0A1J3CGT9_NOCCA
MAETVDEEDSGVGRSVEVSSNGQHSQSGEALSEWRSSGQVENGTPSTSPPYWDSDQDDDYGLKPSELFGKHKWKIEKFSEINKRELRSSVFEAGGYKWYILIYPQGCDVCNHLSLFLCVANHDKLLPGWGHFAQFTIAVVHKESKKSKFSDTLHRFWKKEHDWGWKKFIELSKLKDGFIDESGSLTIDAQVQVIRERVDRPFRCLHCEYRRELVSVYLTNVDQNCRRFIEERRSKLGRLIEDKARWTSFGVFWLGMDQNSRRRMSREKMDVILKGVVKQFFIDKEVTSTLVMDSLYSGLKALESQTKNKKARSRLLDAKELPAPVVSVDKDMFVLVDDVLSLLERVALEPLPPPKDGKGPQNRTKDGNDGEEINKEAVERDERSLTELGRRTVEIFVLDHIFCSKIEVAYQEAIALRRQEELIREEEEAWLAETEQRAKRGAAEREKKSKKKQAKQKRHKNKGKDKKKEEKLSFVTHEKDLEENQHDEEEKDSVTEKAQPSAEKPDTLGDVSDVSDSVDGSADILQPDLEDGDSSSVHWETDALEIHPSPSGGSSRGTGGISISTPNGIAERKNQSTMDDSSSTCSNDSIRSGVTIGSYKGNALNFRNQKSPTKGKNQQVKVISDARSLASETDDQPATLETDPKSHNYSSEASNIGESDWVVVSRIQEPESSRNSSPFGKQERNVAQIIVNSVDMDRPKQKSAAVLSSPRTPAKNPSSLTQTKPEKKSVSNADAAPYRKVISATGPPSSSQAVQPSLYIHTQSQTVGLRADMQKMSAQKQPATTTISRPSSAPIIPAKQPAPFTVSSPVQPATSLPRSVSSAGRLGPDPSIHNQQTYVPQSYKHAIVGNSLGSSSSSSSFNHHPSSHGVVPTTMPSSSYSQTPTSSYQASFPFSQDVWTGRNPNPNPNSNSVNMGMNNPYSPAPAVTSNRSLNQQMAQQQAQSLMTDEFPHLDIINDLLEDEQCSNMMFNGSMFNSQYPQVFNGQYSYHGGDLGVSGELLSSGRSRSFGEEGFHYMPRVSAYADGMIPTQWQMANMDLSLLAIRNNSLEDATSAANYHHTYFGMESSNPSFSSGINNGYTEFRPSNGH